MGAPKHMGCPNIWGKMKLTEENLDSDDIPDEWLLGMDDAPKQEQLLEPTAAKEPDNGHLSDTMMFNEHSVDIGRPEPGFSADDKGDEEDKTGPDDKEMTDDHKDEEDATKVSKSW